MNAQEWAARIQGVIRAAAADGYEAWIDDEFEGQRIEVRIGKSDDDALILEWNA
ncbi:MULTISPECIES: hypothetical protein [Streptomyces]|uniref:hypothetical protein n=1 Tax=Streptomyces TaxID=1883 RepID=UPI00142DCA95|nr:MULTISPECIES: hypothetical protein [Streptomyces]